MNEKYYNLSIEFLEPILGSQPSATIASEYLAKRAGFDSLPEDEIETLPDALDKGTTAFHHDADGNPLLYDLHIKGFLKNAAKVFNGKVTGNVRNLRSKVSQTVFVTPRRIKLNVPEGEEITFFERPLRAETAQGPRVALARSEMLPAGTTLKCSIAVLSGEINEDILRDLLDYGYWEGIGQFRGGSFGRFRYTLTDAEK